MIPKFDIFKRPHGNSKHRREPYMRTFPSVIAEIKKQGKALTPKHVVSSIQKQSGGVYDMVSPSAVTRDRMQVYNALRAVDHPKSRNTGVKKAPDFTRLQLLLKDGKFVKRISSTGNTEKGTLKPLVFATTDTHMSWIKKFCSTRNTMAVLGVDMTYKCGPFYVTIATFKHPNFARKDNPNIHPGIVAALATSVNKEYEDYRFLSDQLKCSGIDTLVYGTDGEPALERAFEDVFPIEGVTASKLNIHLRCFDHVKTDIKRYLENNEQLSQNEREKIIKQILGTEFNGKRLVTVATRLFLLAFAFCFIISGISIL